MKSDVKPNVKPILTHTVSANDQKAKNVYFYNIDNLDFAAGLSKGKSVSSAFRTRLMTINVNLRKSKESMAKF